MPIEPNEGHDPEATRGPQDEATTRDLDPTAPAEGEARASANGTGTIKVNN